MNRRNHMPQQTPERLLKDILDDVVPTISGPAASQVASAAVCEIAARQAAAQGAASSSAQSKQRARDLLAKARQPLLLEQQRRGAGGELVSLLEPDDGPSEGIPGFDLKATLENPDYVAADASRVRIDLAQEAGCLELALDMADTVGARNSLEMALAHQLALAHTLAMKFGDRAGQHDFHARYAPTDWRGKDRREFHAVEGARAANAATRLMEAFQRGALALQQLRTGGRQKIVVQHQYNTQVNDTGKAVVGARGSGGKSKGKSGRGQSPK